QMGDAVALSATVDALIVIARIDVVRRPMLEELRRILDATPVRVLGFVLTGTAEESGYGGYYRHSYAPRPDAPVEGEDELPPAPTTARRAPLRPAAVCRRRHGGRRGHVRERMERRRVVTALARLSRLDLPAVRLPPPTARPARLRAGAASVRLGDGGVRGPGR